MGEFVMRFIDFLILHIPTPLVSVLFCSSIPIFCSFKKMFFVLVPIPFVFKFYALKNFLQQYKYTDGRLRASHGSYNYEGCT